MLKMMLDSLEEIPEELKSHYKEEDGKFVLELDEKTQKLKIDEFRQNNIALMKEMEELKKKYQNIDPQKYAELIERLEKMEQGELLPPEKVEELANEKAEGLHLQSDLENQVLQQTLERVEEERARLAAELGQKTIDQEIGKALAVIGRVRPEAMEDVLNQGRRDWKMVEGQPMPMDENGEMIMNPKTSSPISFEDWARELLRKKPFLFENSQGSGASGSGRLDGVLSGGDISAAELATADLTRETFDRLAKGEIQFRAGY